MKTLKCMALGVFVFNIAAGLASAHGASKSDPYTPVYTLPPTRYVQPRTVPAHMVEPHYTPAHIDKDGNFHPSHETNGRWVEPKDVPGHWVAPRHY